MRLGSKSKTGLRALHARSQVQLGRVVSSDERSRKKDGGKDGGEDSRKDCK